MEKFFYPRSMVVIGASVKRMNLGTYYRSEQPPETDMKEIFTA